MDKATAERMVDNHARKVLEYNSKDGRFIFGELQDSRAALIEALTQPQVVTDPKPQGEGNGFLFRSIDVTLDEYYNRRMRTRPNQRRLLDLEFIGRIQRMHEPWMPKPEAARVPPEAHIMQAAKLATRLPSSDEADDSASETISHFESGTGKPLHDIGDMQSKPADPA